METQALAVRKVIERYLDAVRTWNEAEFRATFDPKANIAHYYVKGDEIRTISLDEFVNVIGSLHQKYDNAQEKAKEIDVCIVDHIAGVRVPFAFVMGDKALESRTCSISPSARASGRSCTSPTISEARRGMTQETASSPFHRLGDLVPRVAPSALGGTLRQRNRRCGDRRPIRHLVQLRATRRRQHDPHRRAHQHPGRHHRPCGSGSVRGADRQLT